jgi:hypothetical protein
MGLWKSNTIILYQITQLSEQKYRLAIHFAENDFGPFEHIVFVIVLLESPLKILFIVVFASLYLQICIFYQYISISCPTVSSKWVNPNRKYDGKPSKQCDACIVWPWKGQKWFTRSNCTYTQSFHLPGNFLAKGNIRLWQAAGKFVVAVQRNCWRTRYFTKIRKFEKTTRVEFQLMILHF